MKRLVPVILTGLIISMKSFSQVTDYRTYVTYIANAGFMIECRGKKILIDALFNKGWNTYFTPANSIVSNIINQKDPFNKANLLLITHNHADHFNDSMVVAYLNNNTENILIAPPSVTTAIFKNSDFKKNNQIVELDNNCPYKKDTTINGIRIRSYFISHDTNAQIEHVGFLIDIGNIKVFHSGDSNGSDSADFEELQLQKEKIDIALLNFYGFWSTKEERLFTDRYILPKSISLMHIPPKDIFSVMDSVKLIHDFTEIKVFESSMDRKSYNLE